MENFRWTYCLTDDQYRKLFRIIKVVPGLLDYLKDQDDRDLNSLVLSFRLFVETNGRSTPGTRINLDLLRNSFLKYKKEYEEKNRTTNQYSYDFNLYSILTWTPKPKWANNMTVEEIDYLDHFIPQVIGLPDYLRKNTDKENLYDLVVAFQMKLNAIGKNNAEIDFLLETIKERFYRIMDDHKDAIHYVNHSHQIDDHRILDEFNTDAIISLYPKDVQDESCNDMANKYLKVFHPYISSVIFHKYFRANKINIALSFAHQAFNHIFSSPNIYWHNKEAIFGCVNVLQYTLDALGTRGIRQLYEKNPKMQNVFLEALYLLLSRTIYWSDKETDKNEKYDDTLLPINIQHKLRAYKLRAELMEFYGEDLVTNISIADVNKMSLADLFSAHYMAYSHKIVGNDSIFKKEAIRIFHSKELFKEGSPESVSDIGFQMNDELAMAIHKKYKDGKYSLPHKDISDFIRFLREYFKNEQTIAIQNHQPISYLKKDNFSPEYKAQREEIRNYLQSNGINCLYHFTEKSRLQSIIKFGGLLSYKRCLDESGVMPVREDMALTRDIDAKLGLEDYVRLSFCSRLPKIKERQAEGAELVLLKIDPEVALFEDTLFTDIEATRQGMRLGNKLDDLKNVNIEATQKVVCNPNDVDYWQRQAEVLVRSFIPLKYIINIKTPEILD